MSRIRSVHPGLFTDEAFVSLSDGAQIFFIGLWTECDDQGAFEWKPVQLRLKLRGNRDGSVEPILAELEAANCIKSYEHNGRKYGLVRNFTRYQRPKKPNSIHFIPHELRTYTGSSGDSSEPVPHQFPTGTEKSSQMEDEGGRMEEEGGREREARALKEDPKHWKEAQDALATSRELTDWEVDFLHSVKWSPTLSKVQTESLKAIKNKINAKSADQKSCELPSVRRGTASYDAWIAHYQKKGKSSFYEKLEVITVPSEFPPEEMAAS